MWWHQASSTSPSVTHTVYTRASPTRPLRPPSQVPLRPTSTFARRRCRMRFIASAQDPALRISSVAAGPRRPARPSLCVRAALRSRLHRPPTRPLCRRSAYKSPPTYLRKLVPREGRALPDSISFHLRHHTPPAPPPPPSLAMSHGAPLRIHTLDARVAFAALARSPSSVRPRRRVSAVRATTLPYKVHHIRTSSLAPNHLASSLILAESTPIARSGDNSLKITTNPRMTPAVHLARAPQRPTQMPPPKCMMAYTQKRQTLLSNAAILRSQFGRKALPALAINTFAWRSHGPRRTRLVHIPAPPSLPEPRHGVHKHAAAVSKHHRRTLRTTASRVRRPALHRPNAGGRFPTSPHPAHPHLRLRWLPCAIPASNASPICAMGRLRVIRTSRRPARCPARTSSNSR
ncbi:hypothetical protein B0H15DRAFT_947394 [Mycena belliarum]|uniref:Uncharacterized protein n=1 Tax=Mycena belliarum TaxID=1033014 RepID=A0AAD6UCL3_9AGAR|nr:hypothetical protein B0H15DRAFT_947394 [Mycena belliae]